MTLALRQDKAGCYWLEYEDSNMHPAGPYDLDEIEDWITAAEWGYSLGQIDEYVCNKRWARLHPEFDEEDQE